MNTLGIARSIVAAVFLAIGAFAQGTQSVQPVTSVDLQRFGGTWYEIARYPNKFQKQCVGNNTSTYIVKSGGNIEVQNKCLKKDGTTDLARAEARIADNASNAKLKVRTARGFLSPFGSGWADYWILDLGPNYEYAVVGHPDREYVWILSRKPQLSDVVYQQILRRLETQGYRPGKLERTAQNVEPIKGSVVNRP